MTKVEPIEQAVPETRIDLLNRQSFVDRLLETAKLLSENRKHACYAVDGDWGVGKTFVLDMFEEQAAHIGIEGDVLSRFVILRYNCWEYDFYEEPLIAIVSSLLDQIDLALHIIPQEKRAKIKATFRRIGSAILWGMIDKVKEKTGVPIREIAETLQDGTADGAEELVASKSFDHYFEFKKNLGDLRTQIAELSKEQTVLFIVDELDRCLPEYTIKILERLHHLFFGIDNVQVILATDMGQLKHTIQKIYGLKTDVKRYLQKIIQFSLKLDVGTINDRFEKCFENYVSQFNGFPPSVDRAETMRFITTVFEGIDIRKRIATIDKCTLVHNLCKPDTRYDSRYMCVEVFLSILFDAEIVQNLEIRSFNFTNIFDPHEDYHTKTEKTIPQGLTAISDYVKANKAPKGSSLYGYENGRYWMNGTILIGQILYVYRKVLGFSDDVLLYSRDRTEEMAEFAVKFWQFLLILE